MHYCFRLTKGMDLKREIEEYSIHNKLSGVILSAVGCLEQVTIRLADGHTVITKKGMFEIVSTTGTLSEDGVHIHISVADQYGNVIGGHLKDGCIVSLTAEVVLDLFDDVKFKREFDDSTGYEELVVHKNIL